MSTLAYDRDASERLSAIYVTPDVVAQRRHILQMLNLQPGERVLDIGSGPGFLASSMAEVVRPVGWVCGVDISEPLLLMSRALCTHQLWVEFHYGNATRLPFPDNHFDVGVSTQVYEYVTDVDAALKELYRVLRPGGRVLIVDTDWDSIVWHTRNHERMKRILAAWDEHLVDPHLPRTLVQRLRRADFLIDNCHTIPLLNAEFSRDTYSNRIIDLIVPFVSGRQGLTREEVEAWAGELRQLGEEASYFFSLNRYLFRAHKAIEVI